MEGRYARAQGAHSLPVQYVQPAPCFLGLRLQTLQEVADPDLAFPSVQDVSDLLAAGCTIS